jgi:hypothetical protein
MHVETFFALLASFHKAEAVLERKADNAVLITVPTFAPSSAFQVRPNFPGFAFEERSFYKYFGTFIALSSIER